MRLETSFELQDLSTTATTLYLCENDVSENQFFEIEKAEVIQTDLGTYVDIYYSNERGDDLDNGLCFRIVDADGKEYDTVGSSGTEYLASGKYKQRCKLAKCKFDEKIFVEAFDCFTKEVYGMTELSIESAR